MATKKVINDPQDIVKELFEGFVAMHHPLFYKLEGLSSVVKRELDPGKVGLLIGGGSGHEPIFIEYIGKGFADAVSQGNIFAAPTPDNILAATKAIDRGRGVLYVYGNYAGDNLNFDMAAELAEFEGIKTATVRVMDDVAAAPPERMNDRRGIAGDFFVIKVAGAVCDTGLDLDQVQRITEKARDHTRSLGVAVAAGSIPGINKPTFELPEDEIEIGMGLHGEPGVLRKKMTPADPLVAEMMERLISDLPFREGNEVCLGINNLGATTLMELWIVNRKIRMILREKRIAVYDTVIGSFCTCQEMAGFSISLMKLDPELKKYYDLPASSLAYNKV
jgi:dihydroxyacetone kinase-like protein